ncbi:MAG: class I mannose-6-phosphate isomerase [Verrucomicrobiota bacterium JB023]|nr:class I mannose-6-phosphate isomerase [Verrucomicrobiota bacterium JB023]
MNPITFTPLYKTRVWGGRSLETIYGRQLPDDQPYGEAWEIVDREDDQSVVASGPFEGKSLHELWTSHREEVFGKVPDAPRFPILIKILDCRDDLSIQVHPPVHLADSLNGEPKTEMWFIADATPDASLYIGFKEGVTRESFEQSINEGTVAEAVHKIVPKAGESIFIPSGRCHAIGGGNLIFEIQQNSDTTYRVFDWNRMGLDGKPRQLHVEESLASIDFNDFEPGMDTPEGNTLAKCDYFHTERFELAPGEGIGNAGADRFSLIAVVSGCLTAGGESYQPGQFVLLPPGSQDLSAGEKSAVLRITIP